VCGVEHSNCTFIELKDEVFFGVYADTVAGKFSVVKDNRYPVPKLDT
jgi:hypothetical protein